MYIYIYMYMYIYVCIYIYIYIYTVFKHLSLKQSLISLMREAVEMKIKLLRVVCLIYIEITLHTLFLYIFIQKERKSV